MKKILLTLLSLALLPNAFAAKAKTVSIDKDTSNIAWSGEKITGDSHMGTIAISDGELMMKKNKLVGGTFTIDMNTIVNTDLKKEKKKQQLVGHLKSEDFFAVEKYPTAKFVITDVKAKKDGLHSITGNLTLRGNTKPVNFDAKVSNEKDGVVAKANITFDRSEFDVKYNSGSFFSAKNLGDKLIKDEITLNVILVAGK